MSNQVTLFGGANLPTFAKTAAPSALAKALAGGGTQGKRLSIKGGTFRLMVDGEQVAAIEERYLDVVIVAAAPKVSRVFYAGKWDPDKPSMPDCSSADGERPDAGVKEPQNQRCADCPQNQKGSGEGESRACRFNQRIALVLANDLEGHVLQLQVPATSLFGREQGDARPLQAYAKFLAAQNVGPDMVITRMKFDTTPEHPKLFFKPMRWLTEEEYEIAQEQGKSEDAQKAITSLLATLDGVAAPAPIEMPGQRPGGGKPQPRASKPAEEEEPPAPAPRTSKPAAPAAEPDAPAPTPRRGRPPKVKTEAAPVEAEPEPEPTVRQTKAEPVASTTKSSLAKMAEEWDDED